MINYNFQQQFGPQIATGAAEPKTLTFRRGRKPPSRHASVGEPAGLWTGLRTKSATRRGVGLVMATALVRFSADGILLVSELRERGAGVDANTAAMLVELRCDEVDALARRDGFENWDAAWRWHDANRDQEHEKRQLSLVRHLIAWQPLTPEQIAGIETGAAQLEGVL